MNDTTAAIFALIVIVLCAVLPVVGFVMALYTNNAFWFLLCLLIIFLMG